MENEQLPIDGAKIPQVTTSFDSILTTVGELGRYQRRLILLFCTIGISVALHKLAWVFLGAQMEYRCLLPWENAENATYSLDEEKARTSFPWNEEHHAWSRCERLQTEEYDNATGVQQCEDYVFDTSVYSSSAVQEFSLICNDSWIRVIIDSGVMFGDVTGSLLFGSLSDKLGRRPVFYFGLILQLCVGLAACVAPTIWIFLVTRIIIGATLPGVYVVAYVIGTEIVGPSKRQYAGLILQMSFSLGYMLVAGLAYVITDWRHLQLALTLPGVFYLSYWWLVPESPRWLLSQGSLDKTTEIIQKIAKVNKCKDVSETDLKEKLSQVVEQMTHRVATQSLLSLMRFPALRRNALIIFLVWIANNSSYFGLSFNTGSLAGNPYINFVISGAVEIPAYILVLFMVNVVGRKPVLSISLFLTGISLLLTIAVPIEWLWLHTTLAMLGKMAITASCGCTYVISAEIFPTSIRNAGLGVASTIAGIGGMLAPLVILLSSVWQHLPFMLLGSITLTAGFMSLMLPETLGRELPETLEDGEAFSKGFIFSKPPPQITIVNVKGL